MVCPPAVANLRGLLAVPEAAANPLLLNTALGHAAPAGRAAVAPHPQLRNDPHLLVRLVARS